MGMAEVGGMLMFSADDGTSGREPWMNDARDGRIGQIQDIAPGPASSSPFGFVVAGALVYFRADDGTAGLELWAARLSILANNPAEALRDLRAGLEGLGIPEGIENSLSVKLEAAMRDASSRTGSDSSIRQLQAFINEIEAQRRKTVPEPQAEELIDFARSIIDLLDAP